MSNHPKPADAPAVDDRLTDQEEFRREKFRRLVAAGVPPFPYRAERTHSVRDIVRDYAARAPEDLEAEKTAVVVPGRIMSVRKMGRASFCHLSDGRARLQAYFRSEAVGPEAYERFGLLDIGDVISVRGRLFKTRTGELTVAAEGFTFLAKCLHPLPEKWHGLQDIEIRSRKRYLDLIMNPEVGETFRTRGAVISKMRKFFDGRGYLEVETPMMHPIPGGALARPFVAHHNALDIDLYLRIAPELYLKRLVVGGFEKVYEINRNFRNEGVDAQHNTEFTMLEFYEAYADFNDMMRMTEELLTGLVAELSGGEEIPFGDQVLSFKRPYRRIKFMDALVGMSGLAPSRFSNPASVVSLGEELAPDKKPLGYGKALDVIFERFVRDQLIQPTFVLNPPRDISPLAKPSRDNPAEAERFELFAAGMEIANAFSELTDPEDQRRLFEEQAAQRLKGDQESHVVDLEYVEALEYGLPPTGGEGIGIDRLVMLLTNQRSIRDVILFPLFRPKG